MSDWRAYDAIAGEYEQRWGPRFEEAGRHLLEVAACDSATRILDLGTGTGAVVAALGGARSRPSRIVGCDLSVPMLSRAHARHAEVTPVAADAMRLPFRRGAFDLVTANCVLSHVRDYRQTLAECLRVLASNGRFAASNWGPVEDVYSAAWTELLGEAVGGDGPRQAVLEVAPWEAHFATPDHLHEAFCDAGFVGVRVDVSRLDFVHGIEEYVADRALGSAGRFGRHTLGEAGWRRFLRRAEDEMRRRFAEPIGYSRSFLVGVGSAP